MEKIKALAESVPVLSHFYHFSKESLYDGNLAGRTCGTNFIWIIFSLSDYLPSFNEFLSEMLKVISKFRRTLWFAWSRSSFREFKVGLIGPQCVFFSHWTHLQRMVEKNWVIPDQTVKFLKILAKKQVKNQCNKCVTEGIFVWNEHYLHRNRVKKSDSIPMDTEG